MSGDGIVLSKIASAQNNKDNNDISCFFHKQQYWKFLDAFSTDDKIRLQEIVKLAESGKLKTVEFVETKDHGGRQLAALYKNADMKRNHRKTIDALFDVLFGGDKSSSGAEPEPEEAEDSAVENRPILKTYVTTKLFEALQRRHNAVVESSQDLDVDVTITLPTKFLPTLCNYQLKTVKWLLSKEKKPSVFSQYFEKLEAKDNETIVYRHLYDRYVVQGGKPADIIVPPGGILAEEMGLGKTVEILALILLHPRIDVRQNPRLDVVLESSSAKRKCIEFEVFCICPSKSPRKVIQCSKCFLWQHSKCVAKYSDDELNSPYLCPSCWQSVIAECGLLKTKGTFIVSPSTIKLQWLSEIKQHIQPSLRVFLYEGVVAGKWISPRQLADYDVVLTDYNILRKEIYYTNENVSERLMRNKPRSIRMHTPVLMLEWYRVCLDEAQMVESNTSNVASLVRMLPSMNRWAVTGTPIQRSLNDLQPLLQFVGFDIVTETSTWNHLVNNFLLEHESSNADENSLELVKVLQKCMWRTWKSQISDELQIPPQQQIVHRIQFDNLETLFYNEQHAECKSMFMGNVRKYTSRMSTISPQIMKVILQPFLKIRQSCTMPVVVVNSNANKVIASQQKQFLQPTELHSYLKSSNEISCKTELRAMASSHNGLAALYFIQQKYDDAIKHYNAVLRLANDYVHMNVTVDSLLQIHALHNLIEIKTIQSDEKKGQSVTPANLEPYQTQYNTLEWKYLSIYSNTLANVMTSYRSALNKTKVDVGEKLMDSMSEALNELNTSDIPLFLQKLHEECLPRFGVTNLKLETIQSTHSLLYVIDMWFTKLHKLHKTLKSEIDNLRYFTDNVKSRNQVMPVVWKNIMELVHSVYDCHLSEIREKKKGEKDKNTKNNALKKKFKCKMCCIRDDINRFECLLFDKVIDKDSKLTEGLENHSLEMFICKITLGYLKNKISTDVTKTLENNWLHLENLQMVCKRMIKLWIEIEYTIKAYDELNMCKLRLTLTEDPDDKSIYKVLEYDIEERIIEQQNELQTAQRQFTMKLARLKYIKHLESDMEMGPCPICRSTLEYDRYVVLECGHHICFHCFKSIQQYSRGSSFKCSVCRNIQQHQNLYYVCRSKSKTHGHQIVKGNYTSKIMYIVRLILKLQRHEMDSEEKLDLKILIFSQWTPILQAISAALKENDITFRIQCTPQTLEDFKNPQRNITCLLMPFVQGSKGLNLVEATHVFLVEPILNPGEELQAIGRVHRFGQTRPTTVHRFIMDDSIEENIHNFITKSPQANCTNAAEQKWELSNVSLEDFENLFVLTPKD